MYYKGNNIGLNYDAANGTWSFSNEPQDYIDKNAFSTPDPIFNYTPPADEADDEEDTNCPEGYIYDNTLKQCVPDPAKQNQYSQQQNQGGGNDAPAIRIAGTNKTTTTGNFRASDAEYKAMSSSELIENYKQRGFIKKNDKGELVIDFNRVSQGGAVLDSLLGRFSGGGESQASLNKVINYLVDKNILTRNQIYETDGKGGTGNYKFNSEVVIPTIAKFEADYYGIPTSEVLAPGFGDSIYGTKASVQQFDDYMAKKLAAFSTVANNTISNYNADTAFTGSYSDNILQDRLDKEKERKAKFDADIAKAKAEREMQKTIKEAEQNQAENEKKEEVKDDYDSGYSDYEQDTTPTGSGSSGSGFSYGTGSSEEYDKFGDSGSNSSSSSSSSGVSYTGNEGTGTAQSGGVANPHTDTGFSGGTKPSSHKCFHPEQLIGNKFIKDLEPGDLINGIKILGMVKLKLDEDMYSLNDVRVTGTHKVKYNNTWMYVSNHPESFKINDKPEFVYVPIVEGGTFIINNNEFADYDDEHIETLNNRLKIA